MVLSCRSAGAQARLSATDATKVAGDGLIVVLPMYDSEHIFPCVGNRANYAELSFIGSKKPRFIGVEQRLVHRAVLAKRERQ